MVSALSNDSLARLPSLDEVSLSTLRRVLVDRRRGASLGTSLGTSLGMSLGTALGTSLGTSLGTPSGAWVLVLSSCSSLAKAPSEAEALSGMSKSSVSS